MSERSATPVLSTALETAINGYLRLDADYERRLASLLGKTIGITLDSLDVHFFLTVTASGIRIRNHPLQPADVMIHTPSPLSLLQLFRNQTFSAETTISGDSEVARRWQSLMRETDIDWEEHLSRVFGDIAAHQVANTTRASLAWGRNSGETLLQNLSEYLRYERNDLPARHNVEHFLDAVDELTADTERLAARIDRLYAVNAKRQEDTADTCARLSDTPSEQQSSKNRNIS